MIASLLSEKVALLHKTTIFSDTDSHTLSRVSEVLIDVVYKKGERIITKGEMGDCMYILYKGRVKVHDGEHTIVELVAGSIFGEFAVLDSEPRSASVSALEDCILFRLDQADFYRIIAENPEVINKMIKVVLNRVRNQTKQTIENLKRREQELEAQVEERTRDLQEAFQELSRKKESLELAYSEIEEKNEEITASIRYARRIQQAILPNKEQIKKLLPLYFTLYKPKDIVSGDFYWITEKDGRTFFAACDCTGHGVPGAFMSVLGNSLLNAIVKEGGIREPNLILDQLHNKITETLRQADNVQTNDGMDVALCVYDPYHRRLKFAGAQRPLFYFRNGEMLQILGDKQSIGGGAFAEKRTPFTPHEFEIHKGDSIYIFSDGYADQFGGPKGKKMQTSRLVKFLTSIQAFTIEEQYYYLDKFYEEWKGDYEQIDDVLMIGVRFT
jgi:serine phosphatase RsbU (regulator of sigma subunit)